MLEDLRAAEHLAGVAHEVLEQRELLGRQLDRRLAALDRVRHGVEDQIADRDRRGALDRPSTGERAQTGEELGERERLDEVVVGSRVEPLHPILDGVSRREHQDR